MAKSKSFSEDLMFGFEMEKEKKIGKTVTEKELIPKMQNNLTSASPENTGEEVEQNSISKKENRENEIQVEEEQQPLKQTLDEKTIISIKDELENFVQKESPHQKKIYITKKLDELSKTSALYVGISMSKFMRNAIIEYLDILSQEHPDLEKIIKLSLSKDEK